MWPTLFVTIPSIERTDLIKQNKHNNNAHNF